MISSTLQFRIRHKFSNVFVLMYSFFRNLDSCPALIPYSFMSLYWDIFFSFIVSHKRSYKSKSITSGIQQNHTTEKLYLISLIQNTNIFSLFSLILPSIPFKFWEMSLLSKMPNAKQHEIAYVSYDSYRIIHLSHSFLLLLSFLWGKSKPNFHKKPFCFNLCN